MRFHPNGPSIPDILLERCDAGRVVFLCGAGVSLPSEMPDFVGLTKFVIDFFDPPADSEIMVAFLPWLDSTAKSGTNVPLDQIFNLLHLEYGKDEVNALVTKRLSETPKAKIIGREHDLIKRISSSQRGVPQIVTTNFDRLFELDQGEKPLPRHVPPAFPDLKFGSKIEGITYLHGRLVEVGDDRHPYVLSSADFGRAYLSEGWATNFVRVLLERHIVVLVGYKAEDPPIKYLLQGLNHDGQYDRSRLYAFDRGSPEEIEAKWRDRGATAIAYSAHSDLWQTMEAWAARADDARKWRSSIIAKTQHDPKTLTPYERGQVAHVLRTVQGARLFAQADPIPHPEWICVMDANVRSGKQSSGYGADPEVFDPFEVYGLDDDLKDISKDDRTRGVRNDSLIVWRDEDENPHEFHRLGGRPAEGFEATPMRLGHLINWITRSIDSPVLAWWAVRQIGLHPRLIQQFEWEIEHSKTLDERGRHIWNLILECHRDPRSREGGGDWFGLIKRIKTEGWTASVLREFRRVATPRLEIKPPFGLSQSKPPFVPWCEIQLGEIGQYDVVFLERHDEDLDIPDDLLPQIVALLEEQLSVASGLLADIESNYFHTPTCYPGREVDGELHVSKCAEVLTWFLQLFDRLAAKWPDLANARVRAWPSTDRFFFQKLKLYALNNEHTFQADQAAEEVLSLDQQTFWDREVVRELLFLLVDRWSDFSPAIQNLLTERILIGPDQNPHWPDQDFPHLRDISAARYARYLQLRGCELSADRSQRLTNMIEGISDWRDAWATTIATEGGSHSGWVRTDDAPDAVLNLPLGEVISRAKEDMKRDLHSLVEKRPFNGLVKAYPRKALSALSVTAKAGEYPTLLWSSMISDFPTEVSPRLKRVFLNRLARLPNQVIVEQRHTFGRWLEQKFLWVLDLDEELGWVVYDRIVDGILSAEPEAVKSSLTELRQGGVVVRRSRRTFGHALNGPVGMCTQALFLAMPGGNREANSLIPDHIKSRIERLFTAPGEGSDHAVSVVAYRLSWLMHVDPTWTKDQLVPMLAFEHSASEPAWNGFLHREDVPWRPLIELIKPLLLDLLPWVERNSWDSELSHVAAQWLGCMRAFYPNEPAGLTQREMRSVIRTMSDDTRNRFIFWMGRVGKKSDDGWVKHIIPLINGDWPRERRYMTSSSMRAWISLLNDAGGNFPVVYEVVKKFLAPVEANDNPLYRFTRDISDEAPISAQFPEATLDFLERITPQTLTRSPHELPKVLRIIADSDPQLTSDPRYLRLINLVELT